MWKNGLKTLPFCLPVLAVWVMSLQQSQIGLEQARRNVEYDQMDLAIDESEDAAWDKFGVDHDREKWTKSQAECKSRRLKLERHRYRDEFATNIRLTSLIFEIKWVVLFISVGVGLVFHYFGPKQVSTGPR